MFERTVKPTPPAIAIAWCLGVAIARLAGPLSTSPWPWLSLAAACACFGRGRSVLLACAVLVGGAASANWSARDAQRPHLFGAQADDRAVDTVAGRATGAVEDIGERRRFDLELAPPNRGVVRLAVPSEVDVLPGDQLRVRTRLRTPRGYRNPGGKDSWRAARDRGHQLVGFAAAADVRLLERTGGVRAVATAVQRRLARRIAARPGEQNARAVVAAMVVGDRSGLGTGLRERFAAAGLAHVLAVSGLHLAVTALLVFAAARRLWALCPGLARRLDPARAAAAIALPVAVLYTLATGARVSTVRALVVVALVLAGLVLRRRVALADSLAFAALVLSAAHPPVIFDPGFQLSFSATAALAWLLSRRRGASRSAWRRVLRAARDSAVVTVAVAPFTAVHFGTVAFGGVFANLVALPLAELVILPAGLAGVALAAVLPALGGRLIDLAVLGAGGLDAIASATATLAPPVALRPGAAALAAAALAAVGLAVAFRRRLWLLPRRLAFATLAALVVFASAFALVVATGGQRTGRDELRITFLDVGQGDAALVEMPDAQVWLIDGGGLPFVADASADSERRAELPGMLAVLPALRARGIDRIDVAVVSHPHPDHYAGVRAVARAVDIDELWVAAPHGEQPWPDPFAGFVSRLRAAGTRVVEPRPGPRAVGDATVNVLAPLYRNRVAADPVHSANDNSLVVSVEYAGRRVLFSGDIESEGEQLLSARAGDRLRSDVVKVPHHGSRTSSTPAFVGAVARPGSIAVVSCGLANRFNFPAREVVDRWRAAGALVVRTDASGAVVVRVLPDGELHMATFDTTPDATVPGRPRP